MTTISPVTDDTDAEAPDGPAAAASGARGAGAGALDASAARGAEAAPTGAHGVSAGEAGLRRLLDIVEAAQRSGRDAATSGEAVRVEASGRRSPSGTVQAAVIAALITSVLAFAAVGFNALRNDISALDAKIHTLRSDVSADIDTQIGLLRSDMDARFAQIDERFVQIDERLARMDERFDALNHTLLDHTDRLARIETIHTAHPHTHAQQPETQPQ